MGIAVYVYNPSTWEVEAGDRQKFKASQSYTLNSRLPRLYSKTFFKDTKNSRPGKPVMLALERQRQEDQMFDH